MKPAILGSIVSFRDLQWFRILSYPPSTLSCAKARESSILILLREMQVLKMNLSDQKRLRKGTTHSFWTSAVYNTPFADLSFGAINCIDHHWSIIRPLGLFCTIGINSAMSERFTLIILTPCTRITWIWRVWSSHQWLLDSPRVPLRVPKSPRVPRRVPKCLMLRAEFDLHPLQMFNEVHQNLPSGVVPVGLGFCKKTFSKKGLLQRSWNWKITIKIMIRDDDTWSCHVDCHL